MNIGIVTTWFERGAGYVSKQYRDILSHSNQVFIYARGGEEYARGNSDWDIPRVKWGKLPSNPIPTAIDLGDFKKWINSNKIQIVFFNEQHWWDPIILCNRMGVICGAYIDYYTELTVELFELYDFLICNTLRHYEIFKTHPQCFYVPWGTNINLFKPTKYDLVEEQTVNFFHSAGMVPRRKGTIPLIQAFMKINNAKLIIHSQIDIRKALPEFKSEIETLLSSQRLQLIERTISAPGLYHLGDIYVYPSILEGIGLTIAEALSSGLPVITSNNPPMTEFIIEGDNGSLIKIDKLISRNDGYYWPQCFVNIDDLKCKMEWYIENKSLIPSMKEKARLYAEKRLDWDSNIEIIERIFRNSKQLKRRNESKIIEKIILFEKSRPFYLLIKLLKPWWWLITRVKQITK